MDQYGMKKFIVNENSNENSNAFYIRHKLFWRCIVGHLLILDKETAGVRQSMDHLSNN